MQIIIDEVFIHVLDNDAVLTIDVIEYTTPFITWIEGFLKDGNLQFVLDYRTFFNEESMWKKDAITISNRIFDKMKKNLDIEKADMAYIKCHIDQKQAIVGLKLNYETNYTHKKDGITIQMERINTTYPSKIKEGFAFFAHRNELYIKEKSFEEEGKKVYYLSKYALEVENPSKSYENKMKVVKNVIHKLNNELFEKDIHTQIAIFDKVQNAMVNAKEITLEEISNVAYDHPMQKERFFELLERKKLKPLDVIKNSEKIMEILSMKKFKNSLGIEVKVASHLLHDTDFVELIEQSDGSYHIVIKEVFLK